MEVVITCQVRDKQGAKGRNHVKQKKNPCLRSKAPKNITFSFKLRHPFFNHDNVR